jgi:hypothetical protein
MRLKKYGSLDVSRCFSFNHGKEQCYNFKHKITYISRKFVSITVFNSFSLLLVVALHTGDCSYHSIEAGCSPIRFHVLAPNFLSTWTVLPFLLCVTKLMLKKEGYKM